MIIQMNLRQIVRICALFIFVGTPILATSASSQVHVTLNMRVESVNELAVSGNPGNLVVFINPATGLSNEAVDVTTTYGITTNEKNKKITAVLDQPMPDNMFLSIEFSPPSGASSLGRVLLSTVVRDLVIGLSYLGENWRAITYRFSSGKGASSMNGSRNVTFTLIDGE